MNDWEFCQNSLGAVSRSFSTPIRALPGDLQVAVTCGYLLCRIVDTIEDDAKLGPSERDTLFEVFLGVVERGEAPDAFIELCDRFEGESDERTLARNLDRVMRVFCALPEPMQRACIPWVAEMSRGMALYCHRPAGEDGLQAILTVADLERYCYFVAGTVGHMLTELFVQSISPPLEPGRRRDLREHAEAFGLGLQLVNILKDVTDDRERGVSFVPRSVCAAVGVGLEHLCEPAHRDAAHRAVQPLFALAHGYLDRAFAYCLAIPPHAREIRLFCLLPLWMAVRTLVHAKGNDAQFVPGEAVKISREEVTRLVADCLQRCQDDAALREGYAALR